MYRLKCLFHYCQISDIHPWDAALPCVYMHTTHVCRYSKPVKPCVDVSKKKGQTHLQHKPLRIHLGRFSGKTQIQIRAWLGIFLSSDHREGLAQTHPEGKCDRLKQKSKISPDAGAKDTEGREREKKKKLSARNLDKKPLEYQTEEVGGKETCALKRGMLW